MPNNIGAFGENFPYSNQHDMNMDWIIKIAKDFLDQYTNIQNTITEGMEGLDNKAQELENLLQQWYDTHSQDIANQLADALNDLNDWYNNHSEDIATELSNALSTFNRDAEIKAQQTIASIPSDYTELSNTVDALTKQEVLTDIDIVWRNGYYIGDAGNYVKYASFNATEKIPLYDKSGLLRRNIYANVKLNNATYVCFYDADGQLVESVTTPQSGGEYELSITTDGYDAYYVAFSNLATFEPTFMQAVTNAKIGQIYNLLPNKKNMFDPYDTRTQENKYFDANGIITLNGFAITHPIPLKGGISYTFTCARSEFGNNTQIAICDENGKIKSYIENLPVTTDSKVTFTLNSDNYVMCNMSLNVTGRSNFKISETAVFDTDYNTEEYTGKLKNKRILYNGDSIAESRMTGFSSNGGAYPVMIADKTGGTYQNRAVGGATLAVSNGSHIICNDIANMDADGDLICLEGGINDYWSNIPLGTFNKTTFNDTPDTSTITGALESIFRQSINKWVGKPIVFIIIHKVTGTAYTRNTAGYTFEEERERIIEVCDKYSIPYVDIWGSGGLNPYIDSLNNAYMNGGANVHPDGCHPDANGYKLYYLPRLIKLFESVIAD